MCFLLVSPQFQKSDENADVNVSGMGQYLEESETEDDGRALALEILMQRIIDGAQSNW